jgi:hypothetical protein
VELSAPIPIRYCSAGRLECYVRGMARLPYLGYDAMPRALRHRTVSFDGRSMPKLPHRANQLRRVVA